MKNSTRIFHWLPRVLCILAILFVSMFALDAFSPGLSIWQQLGAFLMHLIPSFILLIFLLIAWRWELAGGILFTIVGILLSPVVFQMNYRMNHSFWLSTGIIMSLTVPFIIVGIMFIISSHLKKRNPA